MKQMLTKFAAIALLTGFGLGIAAVPASAEEWRGRHSTYDRSSYNVVRDRDRHDNRRWNEDRHWNRGHDRYYYPPVVYHRPPPRPVVVYNNPPPRVIYAPQPYYYPRYNSGTTYFFNFD